jgi:hypothetical protein
LQGALMKANKLGPVPPIPMIIENEVPGTWSVLSRPRRERR